MDNLSKKNRSINMTLIRSCGTKIEKIVYKYFKTNYHRFKNNYEKLPGKPDFAFVERKVALFLNGCFWHQHSNCKRATIPKSNKMYWIPKLQNNKRRDYQNKKKLWKMGWKVATIWECQLNKKPFVYLDRFINRYIKPPAPSLASAVIYSKRQGTAHNSAYPGRR